MMKPKLIKDFTKLDIELQRQVLELYPDGYESSLVTFTKKDGKYGHALPFETEDKYYLLRMPEETIDIMGLDDDDDDDDDDDGDFIDLDTMHIGKEGQEVDDDEYD